MTLNNTLTNLMNKTRSLTGVTDKIGINQLTNYLNYLVFNKPNLLTGTSNSFKIVSSDSGWFQRSSSNNASMLSITTYANKTFTYSAIIHNTTPAPICLEVEALVNSKIDVGVRSPQFVNPNDTKFLSVTINANNNDVVINPWIISTNGQLKGHSQLEVKEERLVNAPIPGIWNN